jgi:hypothetical protein
MFCQYRAFQTALQHYLYDKSPVNFRLILDPIRCQFAVEIALRTPRIQQFLPARFVEIRGVVPSSLGVLRVLGSA